MELHAMTGSGSDPQAGGRLPRVGSAVLAMLDGRLLLGRRAKEPNRGAWILPGGKVEPFETVAEAARREMREETGLEVEMGPQVGVFEIVRPPDEHRIIVYSWATVISGSARASSDLSEIRFVTRDELEALDVSPIVSDVLRSVGWMPSRSESAA